MSAALIALVTFAYVGVAVSEAWDGNVWLAIVFTGYALANIGLIAIALR